DKTIKSPEANATSVAYYWVNGSGNWSDFENHWAKCSSCTGENDFHDQVPTSMDNVFFDENSFMEVGQSVMIDETIIYCMDMDWTGVTNNPSIVQAGTNQLYVYGSFTLSSDIDFDLATIRFLSNEVGQTITTNGISLRDLSFSGIGGEWTFQDELTAKEIRHYYGKLISNNQAINISDWYTYNDYQDIFLDLGSSHVTITAGSIYSIGTMKYPLSNFNAGTSHIIFPDGGSLTCNNTLDFYKVSFMGGRGYFSKGNILNKLTFEKTGTINGTSNKIEEALFLDNGNFNANSTFNNISLTAGKTYILESNHTQTISPLGNFTAEGTGSLPIEIKSSSSSVQAIIHKDGDPICLDYLYLTNIKGAGTGLSYVGANSDDVFNNEGFIFAACPPCFDDTPVDAPILNSSSVTDITIGETATLILDDLPANNQAIWYNYNQSTELYASADNIFQPMITGSSIFYGGFKDTLTGCVSEVLLVDFCFINATAEIDTIICNDLSDTLLLQANGGEGFEWSWTGPNNFTSNDQSPIVPDVGTIHTGGYSVTITNEVGCIDSAMVNVVTLCEQDSSCAYLDSLVLVDLYNSTNGTEWTNQWDLTQPMSTWYGVKVNLEGCVTILNLANNQLSGSLHASLGSLGSLERLLLGFNEITGIIPKELGNLLKLTSLHLHENKLIDTIPKELGLLSNLQGLNLKENQLTGSIPVQFSDLMKLEVLVLNDNQLTGSIPTEFGEISSLRALFLDDNQLTGEIPATFGELTKLETLELSNNELSGKIPIEFGKLINLTVLRMDNIGLTGVLPPELGNLTEIIIINLNDNQLSGCFPATLNALCDAAIKDFTGNINLSGGGDFDAFCIDGTGGCPVETGENCNTSSDITIGSAAIQLSLSEATNSGMVSSCATSTDIVDTWFATTADANGALDIRYESPNNIQLPYGLAYWSDCTGGELSLVECIPPPQYGIKSLYLPNTFTPYQPIYIQVWGYQSSTEILSLEVKAPCTLLANNEVLEQTCDEQTATYS
ncbi:MAG: hypothetical protein AB8G86_15730, partial [Saprospiraceae bacterium]